MDLTDLRRLEEVVVHRMLLKIRDIFSLAREPVDMGPALQEVAELGLKDDCEPG